MMFYLPLFLNSMPRKKTLVLKKMIQFRNVKGAKKRPEAYSNESVTKENQ